MPKPTSTRTRPRTPLTRERILHTAVALASTEGVAALSMRRLGQALGVEAMSLYNHVADKSDLLDGMVDLVFEQIGLPPTDVDWKTAMRRRALAARDVLTRHPWAIGLVESRTQPGPATLRHHDAVLGCLRAAGFSLPMTGHAYALLDSYIYGFALQQAALPLTNTEDAGPLAESILGRSPANAYPHLTEFTTAYVLKAGYTFAAEFEFGLDLILDALERARKEEREARNE